MAQMERRSVSQKIRAVITPERVEKVKSGAASAANKFQKFMEWGASRARAQELKGGYNDPFSAPRKSKKKTTKKRTTNKKKKR